MEDLEREGRDIILYFLMKSITQSFGIEPALVARGFVNLLKKEMPYYSELLTGEVFDPSTVKGMEDIQKVTKLFGDALAKRKLFGGFSSREDVSPEKVILKTKECTYRHMAKISKEQGYKACVFCPLSFAGGASVAAAMGMAHKSIDVTYDEETETCTVEFVRELPE